MTVAAASRDCQKILNSSDNHEDSFLSAGLGANDLSLSRFEHQSKMCTSTLTVRCIWCYRLTGPARFRLGILARHGNLIVIPHNHINPEWVKSELEHATRSSLHKAFVSSANVPGTPINTVLANP